MLQHNCLSLLCWHNLTMDCSCVSSCCVVLLLLQTHRGIPGRPKALWGLTLVAGCFCQSSSVNLGGRDSLTGTKQASAKNCPLDNTGHDHQLQEKNILKSILLTKLDTWWDIYAVMPLPRGNGWHECTLMHPPMGAEITRRSLNHLLSTDHV